MAAPATKSAPVSTGELLALLAEGADVQTIDKDFVDRVTMPALAAAWARGEVEIGHTKYVTTGNPALPDLTHNGVTQARPYVVIEDGVEWTGPKQRWHANLATILAERLPECRYYQRYCREVCVNREKDVWEWLEAGQKPGNRETRWARRDCERSEAEKLFVYYVRLTDKGLGAAGLPNF